MKPATTVLSCAGVLLLRCWKDEVAAMGHHFAGPYHADLLAEFPYLGVPHNAPLSAEALALVQAAQGMAGHPT